jgi:hypothetical protein
VLIDTVPSSWGFEGVLDIPIPTPTYDFFYPQLNYFLARNEAKALKTQLRDLGMKTVSTPIINEVLVKLLEKKDLVYVLILNILLRFF